MKAIFYRLLLVLQLRGYLSNLGWQVFVELYPPAAQSILGVNL